MMVPANRSIVLRQPVNRFAPDGLTVKGGA